MELFLNLVGISVAIAIVAFWLPDGFRSSSDRKTQVVALALLILILFPIISVTDDLIAAQNPAETDSSGRGDFAIDVAPAPPMMAIFFTLPQLENRFGFLGFSSPESQRLPILSSPEMAPVENRPPPAA